MRAAFQLLVPLIAAVGVPACASAADYYIDGAGGSNDASGTPNAPVHDFWAAAKLAQPGDTIHLLPTAVYPQIYISGATLNGTADKPIVITGDGVAPALTRIADAAASFGVFVDGAHYITIKNLDVMARGSAFYLKRSDHITVNANRAHDSGGAGIQSIWCDYVTVSANTVYGNGRNISSGNFASGISMIWSQDVDSDVDSYKMQVVDNVVYGNTNAPLAGCGTPAVPCSPTVTHSDGNGIIIDRNNGDVPAKLIGVIPVGAPYGGRTLVGGNTIFGNGGRGVHVFKSDHVTVTNNSLYSNNQDPQEGSWRPGEVMVLQAGDIAVTNNILFSDGSAGNSTTGPHVAISVQDSRNGVGPILFDYNLLYNPRGDSGAAYYIPVATSVHANTNPVTVGENSAWGDPQFAFPGMTLRWDYHVLAGSPAIGAGDPNMSVSALLQPGSVDLELPIDIGVF